MVNMTKLRCRKSVKEQLKSRATSTWISLINLLVTLLLLGTFANQRSNYCIVKTTLTLDILASPDPKPAKKTKKAKKSATRKSGELKHSLSSKGTAVSLGKVKTKHLTFTNAAEYILDNRIRSNTSLQAIALTHRQEDEKDLFSFLSRNTSKIVQDLIECVWSMHGGAEKENSETIYRIKPRMHCHMQWKMAASYISSTFLEQYQQICLCCCCL